MKSLTALLLTPFLLSGTPQEPHAHLDLIPGSGITQGETFYAMQLPPEFHEPNSSNGETTVTLGWVYSHELNSDQANLRITSNYGSQSIIDVTTDSFGGAVRTTTLPLYSESPETFEVFYWRPGVSGQRTSENTVFETKIEYTE